MFLVTGDVKSASRFTIFLHILLTGANYGFEKYWQRRFEDR